MVDSSTESPGRTLLVAFLVCALCSLLVSTTAVLLAPRQRANREREREAKLMEIVARQPGLADLLEGLEGVSLEARVVELATGDFADHLDAASFDARRDANDPLLGVALDPERDPARLGRRARHAVVYVVQAGGRTQLVILPVHGGGYASTLYGYLALLGDTNTVAGLSFYEHGETPGLGAEIEDPDWLASWSGKRVRDGAGAMRLGVALDEVDPDSPSAPYEVDGMTGATRTLAGVTKLLRYWLGEDGFGPFLERIRRQNEEQP
jgi:Na+-transporting NADH:ubiquinone oxidoreductase subunit C